MLNTLDYSGEWKSNRRIEVSTSSEIGLCHAHTESSHQTLSSTKVQIQTCHINLIFNLDFTHSKAMQIVKPWNGGNPRMFLMPSTLTMMR